jgi:hypothetical protein
MGIVKAVARRWAARADRLGGARVHRIVTEHIDFVGYPKTGNTWIRFMLGRYLQLLHGFSELPLIEHIEFEDPAFAAYRGPRMQFTHWPLTWETQTAADLDRSSVIDPFVRSGIVLLTRYPLDALVSNYLQCLHIVGLPEAKRDIATFVTDPVFGIDKFLKFHELWSQHRFDVKTFLLVRYEDTKQDPARALEHIIGFIGLPVERWAVDSAVEYASFANMKELETSGAVPRYRSSGYEIFASGSRDNPEAFHVRKGMVAGYRDYIAPELAVRLECMIAQHLDSLFGYQRPPE